MNEGKKNYSKIWTYLLLYPFALILVFEEWGWEPLAAQFNRLSKLPIWKHIEEGIVHIPSWGALIILGVPVLILLPVKLFGLFLFEKGHLLSGTVVIAGAKLFGTALFARLFDLTRPSLMKMKWFATWYPRWKSWKDRLLVKVRHSAPWKLAVVIKSRAKMLTLRFKH